MKFLKGFRTYISLVLVAVLGAAVAVQQGCLENPDEVNKVCEVVSKAWFGQAIVVMSGVAAWFRKLANKMWLTILSIADKLLGVFGKLADLWITRSNESRKERKAQQSVMDEAAKKGDFNAWKTARHKRNTA